VFPALFFSFEIALSAWMLRFDPSLLEDKENMLSRVLGR